MSAAPDARAVRDFWFGVPGAPEHGRPREVWFTKDDDFDRAIATRFGALLERGLAGELAGWADDGPEGALAAIVVLDQFTRNAFRGTARAFAGDRLALALAQRLVAAGDDLGLLPVQRQFVYLPFEHAEDRALQDEALRLFRALGAQHPEHADLIDWADRHHAIVARFGRFPHRNLALGRVSTPEEAEFLKQPGSAF